MAESYCQMEEFDVDDDSRALSPPPYSAEESDSSVSLTDLVVMQEVARCRRHQLCDWVTFILDVYVQPDTFFETMYSGLLFCRLANLIQGAAEKIGFSEPMPKIAIDNGMDVEWSQTCRYVDEMRQFCIMYGSDPNLLLKISDLIYVDREYSLYSTTFELMKLGHKFGLTIPDCNLMETPPTSPSPV